MIPLLLVVALAAAKPLPSPKDVAEGEAASQCIFYYRLQTTFVPGGSAQCEAEGYGLEFMAAHWKEIDALEAKRQQELQEKLQHGRELAEAMKHRKELEPICFAMVLDGGAPPDGGAALCNLVGFTHDVVTRTARHRAFVEEQERAARNKRVAIFVGVGLLALVAVSAVVALVRKRR